MRRFSMKATALGVAWPPLHKGTQIEKASFVSTQCETY